MCARSCGRARNWACLTKTSPGARRNCPCNRPASWPSIPTPWCPRSTTAVLFCGNRTASAATWPTATATAACAAAWNQQMGLLERHLAGHGPYLTGAAFTLADVVVGLSVNRWKATPIDHAVLPSVERYFALLDTRPAFSRHGNNGIA